MDTTPIGQLGVLSVATRGDAGPGEVVISLRGSTETYLAWSDAPLARGLQVVVTDARGPRTLQVASFDDLDH